MEECSRKANKETAVPNCLPVVWLRGESVVLVVGTLVTLSTKRGRLASI